MVSVILGSDSALSVMQACVDALNELQVPFEVTVASAHRTPDRAAELARSAKSRGVKVIIAAAGWAAHLPGVLAAYTTLPVIGVPIGSSPLGGQDALYAIVQMPPGIPVATVGIDTGRNAAILAAQMIALSDDDLSARLGEMRAKMAAAVAAKAQEVEARFRG